VIQGVLYWVVSICLCEPATVGVLG